MGNTCSQDSFSGSLLHNTWLKYSSLLLKTVQTQQEKKNLILGFRQICIWPLVPPQALYEVGQQVIPRRLEFLQVCGMTSNTYCAGSCKDNETTYGECLLQFLILPVLQNQNLPLVLLKHSPLESDVGVHMKYLWLFFFLSFLTLCPCTLS